MDKRHGSFSDLAGAFTMNTTATSEGGWQGCHMRQEIAGSDSGDVLAPKEGTLLALLPEELRAVMKPCTKYTDNTGNSMEAAAVTATQEWLFLLSEWEYYGARTMANEGEQSFQRQYAYYAAGGESGQNAPQPHHSYGPGLVPQPGGGVGRLLPCEQGRHCLLRGPECRPGHCTGLCAGRIR